MPSGEVARFLLSYPLHLSPRRQRVRAALGGGRKKRRFGMAECRVTIWPYFWLICPPCPLDHPNSTPKFRGWRKAGASTFFLFQEGLVTRHPSDLVLVVQRSRLLSSSLRRDYPAVTPRGTVTRQEGQAGPGAGELRSPSRSLEVRFTRSLETATHTLGAPAVVGAGELTAPRPNRRLSPRPARGVRWPTARSSHPTKPLRSSAPIRIASPALAAARRVDARPS